jgi:protein-S-isoprenylcysteine O-methyltransferase Ste14
MRFSNGTELRFGRTKYSKVTVRLFGVGGVFVILSWFIGAPAKNWVGGIGTLALAAGLVVLLAGTIAERKEWQAAHKIDTK